MGRDAPKDDKFMTDTEFSVKGLKEDYMFTDMYDVKKILHVSVVDTSNSNTTEKEVTTDSELAMRHLLILI